MKFIDVLKKYGAVVVFPAIAFGGASNAFAVTAYDTLTAAADWASVSTGIVTIGTALMLVVVVFTGVRMLLSAAKNR